MTGTSLNGPLESLNPNQKNRPHIVMVIARGEAVRNFLYSETLNVLSENARITLLSVIHDDEFRQRFEPHVEAIIPLREYPKPRWLSYLRHVIWHTHYRWLWSKKAKNKWEILAERADTPVVKTRFSLWKGLMRVLAHRPVLKVLTGLYDWASWRSRPTDEFDRLFEKLKPDLVFDTAHIHAPAARLPMRVAHRMGIPTAAFIFSWDNLTTRSRITLPYDYYLVWHEQMRDKLLGIYTSIKKEQIFVTGTPQFDFHFKPKFWLSRAELAEQIGFDPECHFILYTTGMARDFPGEHRHVETVIDILKNSDIEPRPQLIVRTYAKGTSPEMKDLAQRNTPGVVFPPILWNKQWLMPQYKDLSIYTSLLRHAALGINAASTVSLELLMHDKPVINLGFDPPGSHLPHPYRWVRHIEFDHYRPVAESGAVMVARSCEDIQRRIQKSLQQPNANSQVGKEFIQQMFGNTLDGHAGERVARCLLEIALRNVPSTGSSRIQRNLVKA